MLKLMDKKRLASLSSQIGEYNVYIILPVWLAQILGRICYEDKVSEYLD